MSFNPVQFKELIKETLEPINLWSKEAEVLLLGTCAQESHFGKYLRQIKGPACGVFQMEPATEKDIWDNYLKFRDELFNAVFNVCTITAPSHSALKADLRYQIVMARIHYRRVRFPLPSVNNLKGQAMYWDNHYNCNPTKGFPNEYIKNYNRFVLNY